MTHRILAAVAALCLVLSGCGSIDGVDSVDGADQGAVGPPEDNRPVKAGGTLRVGLDNEPDQLDPTLSRTLVGANVFRSICEKLYDVNEKLEFVPQLAAELPEVSKDGKSVTIPLRTGLKFADGAVLDAAAVKASLDRHRTLPTSQRAPELGPVSGVTVVDEKTVRITLSQPFSPLTAQLAERAGMIMSPATLAAPGPGPVCVAPFKFLTRVAQDRIEVVKDPNYYDADKVKLDKIIYRTLPDPTTRFNNLRSGDVDVILNVNPIDVESLKQTPNLRLLSSEGLGYQGITVNVGNANGIGNAPGALAAPFAGPLASDARVRRAFMHSIDRESLTRVVFRNVYTPACGPLSPASPLSSDVAQECSKFDPQESKRLLQEAGVQTPVRVTLTVVNTADGRRVGEAIKSMTEAGGFDVQLEPTEFASALDIVDSGKFQMFRIGWSGLIDGDGNITRFFQTGSAGNTAGYSNPDVDKWLDEARASADVEERRELYGKVIDKIHQDAPIIYLYRQKNLVGVSDRVGQVELFSDYMIRLTTAGFVE